MTQSDFFIIVARDHRDSNEALIVIYPDLAQNWERLRSITRIEFQAQSGLRNGWNGEGAGSVIVENPEKDILIFFEHGKWKSPDGLTFAFKNTYRWTRTDSTLQLEHLRLGMNNPVFLVDLHSATANKWESTEPHGCGNDLYSGILVIRENGINLKWTVQGPRKNETLLNIYT